MGRPSHKGEKEVDSSFVLACYGGQQRTLVMADRINRNLIVAAIDFGTTYSGYAYSWKHDCDKDPLKIYANTAWASSTGQLNSSKTSTTVLFDKNGKFHSFGFEAEFHYANLADDDKHEGWRYFSRFKMELQRKEKLRLSMKLKDDQGQKMKAIDVFGESIKYLKNHLLQRLRKKDTASCIDEEDISWVLTVPAIWRDDAKQFMTEAAEYAGIDSTRLTLALEPEAAAVYCKEQNIMNVQGGISGATLDTFKEGIQFMIIDLGGGTADFTVHEIQRDGSLKELAPPSGGSWGGTTVDDNFLSFIEELYTSNVIRTFKADKKCEYLEMLYCFENKKRQEPSTEVEKMVLKVPPSLENIYKTEYLKTIQDKLQQSSFSRNASTKRGHLCIGQEYFLNILFGSAKGNVVQHLRQCLQKQELKNVTTLVMVGGFSESFVMSSAVREAFPDYRVIVAEEAGLAVLKGAVIIGRNPAAIVSRKMGFTYGISTSVPFDAVNHKTIHHVQGKDGQPRCEDVFHVFVRKGANAMPGETSVEHFVNAISARSIIAVYKSSNESPKYINDDGCSKVGEVELNLDEEEPFLRKEIKVTLIFGDTQLKVIAEETQTGKYVQARFNFLGPR